MTNDEDPTAGRYRYPILKFFEHKHLPPELQDVARQFWMLAHQMVGFFHETDNPQEVAAGLRHLLEAKDCFVRARL